MALTNVLDYVLSAICIGWYEICHIYHCPQVPASDDVAISSVIQPLPQLPEEPPLVQLGSADTAGLAPDHPVILVIVIIILRVSSQHGPVLYCSVVYCTVLC